MIRKIQFKIGDLTTHDSVLLKKGINVVLGSPGTGKTALLEAVMLVGLLKTDHPVVTEATFLDLVKSRGYDGVCSLNGASVVAETDTDKIELSVETKEVGGKCNITINSNVGTYVVDSPSSIKTYKEGTFVAVPPHLYSKETYIIVDGEHAIKQMEGNDALLPVEELFFALRIKKEGRERKLYAEMGNKTVPLSRLPTSTIRAQQIALALSLGDVVVIDDLENALDAETLNKILRLLAEAGKSRQIIVSTKRQEFLKREGNKSEKEGSVHIINLEFL